jgi:tRNA threonylcarbamoyladenosine biosynthesis protein TsaE
MQQVSQFLSDEAATLAFGEAIGRVLAGVPPADVCLHANLIGDLGAGKTTLVRGVLRGLGYAGRVKSPTYPLLETYKADDLTLAHFDLYRLEAPEAFVEAGFQEYFVGPGIRFVEWPDRGGSFLPSPDWCIALSEHTDGGRNVHIEAQTATGANLLGQLSS